LTKNHHAVKRRNFKYVGGGEEMRVRPIELSESEREQLQLIIKKGSDWRERERAQTILMVTIQTPCDKRSLSFLAR
ncbi:MAG: hypothetical protein RQ936_12430, partial [Gammaproteobacteria bacterium]|nr:hypothetical protein [Gammaproteobacteria bacterium]